MKLYNTLGRKKEELKPINPEWVGFYTCGPTVYNYAHIGNLRTYIFEDILQRALVRNGYAVRRVMNITDVGHMTGDTDAGEDKLEKQAIDEKRSVEDIAQFYTEAFLSDLKRLNILRPDIIAPASKFVGEDIALVQTLIEKGFAYNTPNAIYFDVAQFPAYGALSGQSIEEKMVGAREEVVTDDAKRNPADFVLWFKLEGKFKNHILHWPSPWGEGFPGWHVECSAIARHFLGQPFDIHAGGVDLIGTHHTNELAQSEAAYDTPLAHIWMHSEHLLLDGGKMAKSEGNAFTLTDLAQKGFPPLVFRFLTLGAHYRSKLNFTWESLEAAKNGIENLYRSVNDLYRLKNDDHGTNHSLKEYEQKFDQALNDDLNTAQALAVLNDLLADRSDPAKRLELVRNFDQVLGLGLSEHPMKYIPENDAQIAQKAQEYNQLRSNKQFIQSDALRKEMEDLGYSVRDTADGAYIVKRFFP